MNDIIKRQYIQIALPKKDERDFITPSVFWTLKDEILQEEDAVWDADFPNAIDIPYERIHQLYHQYSQYEVIFHNIGKWVNVDDLVRKQFVQFCNSLGIQAYYCREGICFDALQQVLQRPQLFCSDNPDVAKLFAITFCGE